MPAYDPIPRSVAEPFARLDRRAFLRLAGVALASGVVPVGCGGVPAALQPPPGVALASLSPRAYATLQAIAMRCVGPRGAALVAARAIDPAREVDALVARLPSIAAPLGQGLALIEWGLPPLVAKWRPFTSLGGDAQDRVLDDLMRSRLDLKRDLFKGVRSLVMLAFYSDPRSRALVQMPEPLDARAIAIAMADLPPQAG